MVAPAQLSVAVGAVQVTTLPHVPGVLLSVWFEGHPVIVGLRLSTIVIVNVHVEVLDAASVAVYTTE